MSVYKFNGGWKFYRGRFSSNAYLPDFDDGSWERVTLPHSVRLEPVAVSGMANYQGDAWYRKHFIPDPSWKGKKLYLKFEGAMHQAEVWINGRRVCENYGGFLPFVIDVTDVVSPGEEAVIAVRVNNEDNQEIPPGKIQAELDFCYFGGLYRDVSFIVKDMVHITDPLFEDIPAGGGVFVTYEHVTEQSADLRIQTHVRKEGGGAVSAKVSCSLKFEGKPVVQAVQTAAGDGAVTAVQWIHLEHPKLWSVDAPQLYTLTVEVRAEQYQDAETLRIGIREIRFEKEGCFINGEKVLLTGCNRHQEYPYIGFALPDALQYRDAVLIKNAGWNVVRTGHYPQDRAFTDACDELGILVITPTPGWQFYPTGDSTLFDQRVLRNTRQMVRYLRNHPSMGFWEPVINEEGRTPDAFRRANYQAVHEEYPGAGCYCAIDEEYDTEKLYDIIYKKTPENNPEKPGFTREYGDNYREQFDGYEPKLYRVNREENAFGGFYPGGKRAMLANMLARTLAVDGEGKETALERSLRGKYQSNQEGCDIGFCLWAGFDHNRGYCANPACVGVFDFFRIPKYQYFAFQAQNKKGTPMICLIRQDKQAWVLSNCDRVRLFGDGDLLGEKSTGDRYLPSTPVCFLLEKEYQVLRAEGMNGTETAVSQTWAKPGPKSKIELLGETWGHPLRADGCDKLMVYARVTDEDGNLCQGDCEIFYRASGAGKIVGDGNPRVFPNPQRVFGGMGAVLIEAGRTPGEIVVEAQAPGLSPGLLRIQTEPCLEPEVAYRVYGKQESGGIVYEDEQAPEPCRQEGLTKISQGKPASASSGNAFCGNDGNYATEWTADCGDAAPEWTVDLGACYDLKGLKIAWTEDSTTYTYEVQVKGGEGAFETVLAGSGTGQDIGMIPFVHDRVRYVKIKVKAASKGLASFAEAALFL